MLVPLILTSFVTFIAFVFVGLSDLSAGIRKAKLDDVIRHPEEYGLDIHGGARLTKDERNRLYMDGVRVKYLTKDGVKYRL